MEKHETEIHCRKAPCTLPRVNGSVLCVLHLARFKAKVRRKEREQALRDAGLVKVRGALGGTYWE